MQQPLSEISDGKPSKPKKISAKTPKLGLASLTPISDFPSSSQSKWPFNSYVATLSSQKTRDYITKEQLLNGKNYAGLPLVASKGDGVYIFDIEGRKFIDGTSANYSVNAGHNNTSLLMAFKNQLTKLHLTSRAFYNNVLGEACDLITSVFGYEKVLFMNSSDEGVESAIKIARRWAYRVKKVPNNQARILFFKDHTWGSTVSGTGARYNADKDFGPYGTTNFDIIEYNDLVALEKYIASQPDCCAIFVEPFKTASMDIPSSSFLSKIRELCTEHNILMVADETLSGCGRAGYMSYCSSQNVRPDMLVLANGLSGGLYPVSCVLSDSKVMDVIRPGDHGSTYGGNPMAAAVVKNTLQHYLESKLAQNALTRGGELGIYLKNTLKSSRVVKGVRGRGLMYCLELREDNRINDSSVALMLMERGLVTKVSLLNHLVIAPPLIISAETTFEIAKIILETVTEMEKVEQEKESRLVEFNIQSANEEAQLKILTKKKELSKLATDLEEKI